MNIKKKVAKIYFFKTFLCCFVFEELFGVDCDSQKESEWKNKTRLTGSNEKGCLQNEKRRESTNKQGYLLMGLCTENKS